MWIELRTKRFFAEESKYRRGSEGETPKKEPPSEELQHGETTASSVFASDKVSSLRAKLALRKQLPTPKELNDKLEEVRQWALKPLAL